MEFKLLVDQLNRLKLPRNKYVVVGSGSMAAHGIREANDFDVLVMDGLFKELASEHLAQEKNGFQSISLGDIQILGKGSMFLNPEIAMVEEMIKTAEIFSGIPFLRLDLLKKFKIYHKREKDLLDITLIDEYLKDPEE